jgi:hypothetical protein
MAKDDLPPLQDLLRPPSAKDHKPKMALGGRLVTHGQMRMAQTKGFAAALQRQKTDAARRKAGSL